MSDQEPSPPPESAPPETPAPASPALAPAKPAPAYQRSSYPARRIAGTLNRPALFSFICGLLMCVPFAAPLAIILGTIGFRHGRRPNIGGTGFATVGLMLGIVGTVIWIGLGTIAAKEYIITRPAWNVIVAFRRDVTLQDRGAARELCSKSVPVGAVRKLLIRRKKWGQFTNTNFPAVRMVKYQGRTCWRMISTATFSHARRVSTFIVYHAKSGRFEIMAFAFTRPPPRVAAPP